MAARERGAVIRDVVPHRVEALVGCGGGGWDVSRAVGGFRWDDEPGARGEHVVGVVERVVRSALMRCRAFLVALSCVARTSRTVEALGSVSDGLGGKLDTMEPPRQRWLVSSPASLAAQPAVPRSRQDGTSSGAGGTERGSLPGCGFRGVRSVGCVRTSWATRGGGIDV